MLYSDYEKKKLNQNKQKPQYTNTDIEIKTDKIFRSDHSYLSFMICHTWIYAKLCINVHIRKYLIHLICLITKCTIYKNCKNHKASNVCMSMNNLS